MDCLNSRYFFYFFGKGKCTEISQVKRDIMHEVKNLEYLTIISRARVGYEMIDSQPGA